DVASAGDAAGWRGLHRPALLIRVAAHVAGAGRAGGRCGGGRLNDGGRAVPARDELLKPVSLDRTDDTLGDEVGFCDQCLEQAVAKAGSVREARSVDEAGDDRVHGDPATRQLDADRTGERQLGVLRGAVRPRVSGSDRACYGGDVDDVGGSAGFECREERPQAPDRPEVVRADELLDLLRRELEETAATGHAGVVDEQADRWMPLAYGRCD